MRLSSAPPVLVLAVLIAPLLSPRSVAQTSTSRDSSIGIWPWLVGDIDADVPSIVANARGWGFETLYVHVFSSSGVGRGELRIHDEAGTWNPSWGPVSPLVTLSSLIRQAHAQNIRVFAVINCFYATTPTPSDAAHRDFLAYDVIDYLINSFDARGRPVYALDGVALDRVRYYSGSGTHTRANLTDFLTKARAVIGSKELHAYVPANGWVFDGPVYDAVFNSYSQVIHDIESTYGLHYPSIAPLLDAFLPMAYTGEGHIYGRDLAKMEAYVGTVARYLRLATLYGLSPSTRVVPAIQAWTSSSSTATPATLDACIRGALANAASGFNVFRYYAARNHPSWWAAMTPYLVPNPNRPAARLLTTVDGLTVESDLSASSDWDEPAANLMVRIDHENDRHFDTQPTTNKFHTHLLPAPGVSRYAVEVIDSSGEWDRETAQVTSGNPVLAAMPPFLSASAGGQVGLNLHVGRAAAGHAVIFLLGVSGYQPGFSLGPGMTLALNWDPLTDVVLLLLNTPPFVGFYAIADARGDASAILAPAAGMIPPEAIGSQIFAAAFGISPATSQPSFVTNATVVFVVP